MKGLIIEDTISPIRIMKLRTQGQKMYTTDGNEKENMVSIF